MALIEHGASVDVGACCAVSYGHPWARWLLGDSFHPGGLELTSRLAALMAIGVGSRVLDAGSGRGSSAVHLAERLGCRVTGVTLEREGVDAGRELARSRGVEARVDFTVGDLDTFQATDGGFDHVLLECVLSVLANKPDVLQRLNGFLKPGGRLGLSDVTVDGALPSELHGLLATIGCVGGAVALDEYVALLKGQGFAVEESQDCPEVASSFLDDIGGRLAGAEWAVKAGLLPVDEAIVSEGKRVLAMATEQAKRGVLGYGLVVAVKAA